MLEINNLLKNPLRDKVRQLAEEAFNKRLISGYGDSEYADRYQLVLEGKPRHYRLEYAYYFLSDLLGKPT